MRPVPVEIQLPVGPVYDSTGTQAGFESSDIQEVGEQGGFGVVVSGFQSFRVSEFQSYRVTGLQSFRVSESTHPNPSLKEGRDSSPRESSSSHPLPVSGRGPGGGYLL